MKKTMILGKIHKRYRKKECLILKISILQKIVFLQ